MVLGYQYEARGYGFGFASGLLGAEVGERIRIKRPTFVESANFTVAHTGGERFLYRVNIYGFSDGVVGANLLQQNVLVEAEQERGTYYKLTSQMPFQKVKRHRSGFFLLGHPL